MPEKTFKGVLNLSHNVVWQVKEQLQSIRVIEQASLLQYQVTTAMTQKKLNFECYGLIR